MSDAVSSGTLNASKVLVVPAPDAEIETEQCGIVVNLFCNVVLVTCNCTQQGLLSCHRMVTIAVVSFLLVPANFFSICVYAVVMHSRIMARNDDRQRRFHHSPGLRVCSL
eukprot:6473021-Amphidinium_carterae.1